MKKLFIICSLILAAAFFISCEKETIFLPENASDQSIGNENYKTKLERFKQIMINNYNLSGKSQLSARESFIYLSQLCGETISAETVYGSVDTISNWDFYYFFGNESDVISIYVPRTSYAMDPAFTLYFGLLTDFDLSNLEPLISRDDDVGGGNQPPCYGDPQLLNYALPYTGFYTLAIYNWDDYECNGGIGPFTYDIITTGISCDDTDSDGVYDIIDNCPDTPNADQADTDADGIGDVCDNCIEISNSDQANNDDDSEGDVCDTDDDNDGVLDVADNCPFISNADQTDTDGDGTGDVCDIEDADGDGINDDIDNCVDTPNADQADNDSDGEGDVCDTDDDNDGDLDDADNCPFTANSDQANYDGDSEGDVCDTDDDNDGCIDTSDPIHFSNIEATVDIAGCNTAVENRVTSSCGYTMSDRIDALESGTYKNHGEFLKKMAKLVDGWQRSGLITYMEKDAIMTCAGKANIPRL